MNFPLFINDLNNEITNKGIPLKDFCNKNVNICSSTFSKVVL